MLPTSRARMIIRQTRFTTESIIVDCLPLNFKYIQFSLAGLRKANAIGQVREAITMTYTSGEFEITKSPLAFAKQRRRHFDNHMNNRVQPLSQSYHSALARCRPALRDKMALPGRMAPEPLLETCS